MSADPPPQRIWLLGRHPDNHSGDVTWSTDPDPSGEFDGLEPDAIEYVLADRMKALEAALERVSAAVQRPGSYRNRMMFMAGTADGALLEKPHAP